MRWHFFFFYQILKLYTKNLKAIFKKIARFKPLILPSGLFKFLQWLIEIITTFHLTLIFIKGFVLLGNCLLMAEKNIEQLHLCSEDSSLIKEPVLRVQRVKGVQ